MGRICDSVFITPILKEMASAYHDLCILNEKDKEGWLSSALVGHSLGNKLEPITRGEGVIMKDSGLGMVVDLFGHHEFTVGLDFHLSRKRGRYRSEL
jgi:hypothetical protein